MFCIYRRARACVLFALMALLCSTGLGEDPSTNTDLPRNTDLPKIVSVTPKFLSVGELVTVRLEVPKDQQSKDFSSWSLYLDGLRMPSVTAEARPTQTGVRLDFQLTRNKENHRIWNRLLGSTSNTLKQLEVSVGPEDPQQVLDKPALVQLKRDPPRIRDVYVGEQSQSNIIEVGKRLVVTIENWPETSTDSPFQSPDSWVPIIDGVPIRATFTKSQLSPSSFENRFIFDLDLSSTQARDSWKSLLRGTGFQLARKVTVGVGPVEGGYELIEPYGEKLELEMRRPLHIGAALFALAAIATLLVVASKKNGLLQIGPDKRYSLGKTQMAWWFLIVLGSYLYLAIVTWDTTTLTGQAIALMGISAATGLGARAIDTQSRRVLPKPNSLGAAPEDGAVPENATAPEDGAVPDNGAQTAEPNATIALLASKGFLTDLLSESDTISLHRLQIVIWTVVLSAVFLWSVIWELSMPEFNGPMLALMGVASGTYVGFKIPETNARQSN